MVDIGVEVMRSDLPVYKVTLRNRGQIGIAALSYRALRGGTVALSGRRKTNRNTTVIAPGETLSFTVQTTPEDRGVMDRFEVYAVLWDDGSVEGDAALKTSEDSLAEGYVYQLRWVLTVLSDPNVRTIDALRSAFERLPIDSGAATSQQPSSGSGVAPRTSSAMGQQIVKTAVLDDLGELARSRSDNADTPAQAWIEGARVRYTEWLTRAVNNAPAAK
jgi:hypothetical protein